ncbi:thioredoxin family protein [Brevibacillus centrosporus]|uniref:thioredoxin family protein n=1 Tax=Brevibacillus centrosporus TaxID=54910 RepID=UPI002E24BC8F|nr:thioredoxin family protein [Brevibacillus centrosporus]
MRGLRTKWLWMAGGASLLIAVLLAWNWGPVSAYEEKIVYVYSDTCGYCQTFRPTLEAVLADYPHHTVERLDIRDQEDLEAALGLGAEATPTVFIVKGEQAIEKLEGDVTEKVLRSFFQKKLNDPLSGN